MNSVQGVNLSWTINEEVLSSLTTQTTETISVLWQVIDDRNVIVEAPLKRTYAYRIDKKPNASFEEILEESRLHILEKFGKKGYATEKMYFEDEDYKRFLSEITLLAEDKEAFKERYIQVNNIKLISPQENNITVKKLTKR